jgi:hypothetical protein
MQVSTQMGPFSIVPEWVLDRGLSSTALKLYIVLARFADWDTGIAFPARDTLADRMGCTEKTVDRVVKELVESECIEKWSRGRYQSAQYRVFQVDPRGTKMSTEKTKMSGEGTKMSSRSDKNVHLTITNEQEPLEQKPFNVGKPRKPKLVADDYQPSDRITAGFDEQYPGLILDVELEKFRDHHMAVGSDFKDWDRAFRKWLRNALQWSPEARKRKAQTISDEEWEAWKKENGYE